MVRHIYIHWWTCNDRGRCDPRAASVCKLCRRTQGSSAQTHWALASRVSVPWSSWSTTLPKSRPCLRLSCTMCLNPIHFHFWSVAAFRRGYSLCRIALSDDRHVLLTWDLSRVCLRDITYTNISVVILMLVPCILIPCMYMY